MATKFWLHSEVYASLMLLGIPVFAKGSNWIPADAFESRVDDATLQWLLHSVLASHQNMIRVWYIEYS